MINFPPGPQRYQERRKAVDGRKELILLDIKALEADLNDMKTEDLLSAYIVELRSSLKIPKRGYSTQNRILQLSAMKDKEDDIIWPIKLLSIVNRGTGAVHDNTIAGVLDKVQRP